MSVVDTIKDRMNKLKNAAGDRLSNIKTEESVRNARMDLCTSCEFLFKPTGNCTKCGCFVKGKTWIADARCPIGKW